MTKSFPIRAFFGVVAGSVAGALWISLASIPFYSREHVPHLGALLFGGLVDLFFLAATFAVIGLPAYVLWIRLNLSAWIPGLVFGFALGMIGSLGYGVDLEPGNLLFGVVCFGLAGIVAAATFLRVAEA